MKTSFFLTFFFGAYNLIAIGEVTRTYSFKYFGLFVCPSGSQTVFFLSNFVLDKSMTR